MKVTYYINGKPKIEQASPKWLTKPNRDDIIDTILLTSAFTLIAIIAMFSAGIL